MFSPFSLLILLIDKLNELGVVVESQKASFDPSCVFTMAAVSCCCQQQQQQQRPTKNKNGQLSGMRIHLLLFFLFFFQLGLENFDLHNDDSVVFV